MVCSAAARHPPCAKGHESCGDGALQLDDLGRACGPQCLLLRRLYAHRSLRWCHSTEHSLRRTCMDSRLPAAGVGRLHAVCNADQCCRALHPGMQLNLGVRAGTRWGVVSVLARHLGGDQVRAALSPGLPGAPAREVPGSASCYSAGCTHMTSSKRAHTPDTEKHAALAKVAERANHAYRMGSRFCRSSKHCTHRQGIPAATHSPPAQQPHAQWP